MSRVGQELGGNADQALSFDADAAGPSTDASVAAVAEKRSALPIASFRRALARWRMRVRSQEIWLDLGTALAFAVITFVTLLPYLQLHLPTLRGEVGFQADEGTELYNSALLRRGFALYTQAWDFKGPVSYAVFALGYAFSSASVKNGRITVMVVLAIWSGLSYLCGRAITRRFWPSILLALMVPLGVWPNWPHAYNEYVSQCLLAAALLAALHASARPELWWLSGMAASLAFWTSLSQGLPALVTLGAAAVTLAWAVDGNPGRVAGGYVAGVLLPTAFIVLWLAARRALVAGLSAIFVFPFAKYQINNLTEYGFDRAGYVDAWTLRDPVRGMAARVMTAATVHTPRVALAVAIVIAAILLQRIAQRLRKSAKAQWRADDLTRLVLPAALVAAALPPLLGKVRSDMCHLGFVQGSSSFAIAALAARWPFPDKTWIRWSGRLLRAVLGSTLTLGVAMLAVFHWRNVHDVFAAEDLDSPQHYYGDVVAARTAPKDRVYILPAGALSYLYAKRDNALAYASLEIGEYWEDQWRPSADQVVSVRPRLLLIEQRFFDKLASYRPEIGTMYFGYSGNYILNERRPGVEFAARGQWQLTELSPSTAIKTETVEVAQDGPAARYTATFLGGDTCLASLDQARFSVFRGDSTYVGQVSRDGKRIEGTIFSGDSRHRFEATRSD